MSLFDPVWESLTLREQTRVMPLLVESVGFDGRNDDVRVVFTPLGMSLTGNRQGRSRMREKTAADASRTVTFTFRSPLREHVEREKRPLENATHAGHVPRVSRLMALAIRFDGLVREGRVKDYAEVARLGFVTRARVTQIMNLLTLAPDIQEDILHLPPRPPAAPPSPSITSVR